MLKVTDRIKGRHRKMSAWFNAPTPRKAMIPAYVILSVTVVLGFARFNTLAEERSNDNKQLILSINEGDCLERVEDNQTLRAVFLGVAGLFEGSAGAQAVKNYVETNYPDLKKDVECKELSNNEVEVLQEDKTPGNTGD